MVALLLSVAAGLGTATVMWLLSGQRRAGWYVSLANQPTWFALMWVTGTWGLLPVNIWAIIMAVRGLRRWHTPPAELPLLYIFDEDAGAHTYRLLTAQSVPPETTR